MVDRGAAIGDDRHHVVHFYRDDDDLTDAVVPYLSAAVSAGEPVVVIATPAHRAALEAATPAGRIVTLDAARTLAEFMVDGRPDPVLFDRVVGEAVRTVAAGGSVRAFGEMVAILWAEGNVPGAMEVERLWNALGATLPLGLFCGYPLQRVDTVESVGHFSEVCELHSGVFAGAPAPSGADRTRHFPGDLRAPRLARTFVAAALREWNRPDLIDGCLLVVTELASNAVRHGRSPFTVSLTRLDDGVRLVVGDRSGTLPKPRSARRVSQGGRGLAVVETLSRRWGCSPTVDGKLVWADIPGPR